VARDWSINGGDRRLYLPQLTFVRRRLLSVTDRTLCGFAWPALDGQEPASRPSEYPQLG
jgi:hypothetical protein